MQNNYWIHVELFPETASKYSALALNQLHAVLLLARAGETIFFFDRSGVIDILSEAAAFEPPAFPYTDEECEDLIEALERDKGVFHLAYAAWPSLTSSWQVMVVPPALTLLLLSLCYGRLSVSHMRLRIV